jgi:Na+-transporting NADH:ubiquinone oxidoreductase subunit NqrF
MSTLTTPKNIQLYGKASGKSYTLIINEHDLDKTVLVFLQDQQIPIASSCRGKMACFRCKINGEILACEFKLIDFIKKFGLKIEIDYL